MATLARPGLGIALPGSAGALNGIVDRIMRLSVHDQVATVLAPMDLDQLQHRAHEAMATLAATDSSGGEMSVNAANPALCSLAVECVSVVERAELSVGPARLVSAGCEVLAELLAPRIAASRGIAVPDSGDYGWLDDTLEELSDQLDFLALEVYCGLGRLEGAINESDALPVVLDPGLDDFGAYWGSIEHRQALQELSAWLLCVVFRALGYEAVSARLLMEFANYDLLCLCALMSGLLTSRPGENGLPQDSAHLQELTVGVMCGLTSPELAFPHAAGAECQAIEEQNRVLNYYYEVLCAAVTETGLLESALETVLASAGCQTGWKTPRSVPQTPRCGGANHGGRFLSFLGALALQAESCQPTPEDPVPPPLRLRAEVYQRADRLGRLLEAVLAMGCATTAQLKELLVSCATLSAAIAAHVGAEGTDDGFTLACRMLLATSLEQNVGEGPDAAVVLAALAALAANVQDLEVHRASLQTRISSLQPEDCARARGLLSRVDRLRIPVCGDLAAVLVLFAEAPDMSSTAAAAEAAVAAAIATAAMSQASAAPPAQAPAAAPPASAPPGLRDLVQNAPPEFRCALDGKLLCDPVMSPGGVVFERSTLASWLQKHGCQCPVTGQPLSLEQCRRAPEIRQQVTAWVRGAGRQRESKKRPR